MDEKNEKKPRLSFIASRQTAAEKTEKQRRRNWKGQAYI